ncbi:MAG: hypothetical protein ACTSW1_06735 [Candidatus Hodarchaeales archaeon]
MEQNRVIQIALIASLLGGLIGGGVSYLVLNPSIEEVKTQTNSINETLTHLEYAIGVSTEQLSQQTDTMESTLRDQINSLTEDVDQLRTMTSSEIDGVVALIEFLSNEPKFHLIFQDRNTFIYDDSYKTDEFTLEGNYSNLYYDIYVENEGVEEYYYNWARISVYDSSDSLMLTMFLEGNEHYKGAEQFFGFIPMNLPPNDYYIEITVNAENMLWKSSMSVWDYY